MSRDHGNEPSYWSLLLSNGIAFSYGPLNNIRQDFVSFEIVNVRLKLRIIKIIIIIRCSVSHAWSSALVLLLI